MPSDKFPPFPTARPLAPAAPSADGGPPMLTVSALNQAVGRMLERNFPLLWVKGEVSNFTRAASGHWYFNLKDEGAQVRAVMFKGRAQYAGFMPREGDKVEVRTLVTLYAPRGDYQLNVEAIRRSGVGDLYAAFLQLKERLEREGLFARERKRALPGFPRRIGIVTSPQAAALRDVLTTLRRRAPHVEVVLYPTPVQGEGAGQRIAAAIGRASERAECDVLLVCRGGGSIEDLWSFNEEVVARAIVAATMPVISGVGHETDFTIADFAADLRAPTPTAAAELAASSRQDWLAELRGHAADLTRALRRTLADKAQSVDWLSRRLVSPSAYIQHERVKLLALQNRLSHANQIPLTRMRHGLQQLASRLAHQLPDTRHARRDLAELARRLQRAQGAQQSAQRQTLTTLHSQLELLNPQRTLERGYAIVSDHQGRVLHSPAELAARTEITIRLAQGSAEVGIASVQPRLD
ncbi:exodeoxyribonuclease VII large subunit [Herbaspirillum seropedicae]|uniref:exodeoxyribonuclease VII large subunit n=1 Tax=Herbaspirillum seropedicae TaxID=964 RepID=UPI0006526B8E|nr:exodeoxyribonuclease VII large subunit [Herbaspirillum seropedicae]AKN64790.1 exodeoxyribonuclease VII large subunit [Herbaspirillum seropedicae]NQE31706.1 exodeoxyribonuclease VII large subunit [Herbaspirillum seropedicae]UMU20731.1 exodeoxyribonuclease VII large subunit [Herbaspirillum seropedicae]